MVEEQEGRCGVGGRREERERSREVQGDLGWRFEEGVGQPERKELDEYGEGTEENE